MKSRSTNTDHSIADEELARIFLKPAVHKHWKFVHLVEGLLRPVAKLVAPKINSSDRRSHDILVFDAGALGDMMMLVPFLQNLRAWFPASRVTLLGRTGPGEFLVELGLIDEWIPVALPWGGRSSRWSRNSPFSTKWIRFIRSVYALRQRDFDLAFASGWSTDLRGNFVIWLAGAKQRVGYGYAGGGFFLTDIVKPDLQHPHVVDRNLQLLKNMAMPAVAPTEALPLLPGAQALAKELLARHGIVTDDLIIGIHPGAGSAVREWGDERFAEIARQLKQRFGARILWFLDPQKPKSTPPNLDAIRLSLSLSQFQAVVSQCRLVICNDSGPMHLAAALQIPVVAVFGPTQAQWFGPWGNEESRVAIRNDIWCRPCADHCIWNEPHCLRLISIDQVMREVEIALKRMPQSMTTAEARP